MFICGSIPNWADAIRPYLLHPDSEGIICSMAEINLDALAAHRAHAWHVDEKHRVRSAEQAVDFVNERGFVFFWPITGVEMPSLWTAAAGDRPVPNNHDDPGHVTWNWKDGMLGKRRWYYGRLLRRRNTIASLEAARHFYALSPNYGDYEQDYQDIYDQGLLTAEARQVYEALLREGALDSLELRRAAHLWGGESVGRFNRALDDLQVRMMALPVGVAAVGRWNYAFIYDIPARHMPDLPEQARSISEPQARRWLMECYLRSVGASARAGVARFFGWNSEEAERTLHQLIEKGVLAGGLGHPQQRGEWLALPELIQ